MNVHCARLSDKKDENSINRNRPDHVRGVIYTKILDSLLTTWSFTIDERERELRGSIFGTKEAFNVLSVVYD